VHWTLCASLLLLLLIYLGYAIYYRAGLLGLQYGIAFVIFLFCLEQAIWGAGLIIYNSTGTASLVTSGIGAFCKASKMTAVRCLLLLVGLGLSITTISLGKVTTFFVVAVTLFYFAMEIIYEYIIAAETSGDYVPTQFHIMAFLGLMIADIIYWIWIVLATYMTMVELKENKQDFKYRQYLSLVVLLIVALCISIVLAFFQATIESSKLQDDYFEMWWLWLAYWEFVYFACVMSVAIIWRPNENNVQYAYSTQIPQMDDGGTTDSPGREKKYKDDKMVKLEESGKKDDSESDTSTVLEDVTEDAS